jgi:hypothetical protein
MKRIRLLVLASAIAVALPFGLATANATGGGGTPPPYSVSIDQYADFDFVGTNIDLKLYVRCPLGATVVASAKLEQSPPETGSPVSVGFGSNPLVVCDGQTHSVGVTVEGVGFDTGWAKATATLIDPGPTEELDDDVVKAQRSRSVYIRHV